MSGRLVGLPSIQHGIYNNPEGVRRDRGERRRADGHPCTCTVGSLPELGDNGAVDKTCNHRGDQAVRTMDLNERFHSHG